MDKRRRENEGRKTGGTEPQGSQWRREDRKENAYYLASFAVFFAILAVQFFAIHPLMLAQASACVCPDRKRPLLAVRLTPTGKRNNVKDRHNWVR
jgi:hypothetical protein